MRGPQDIFPESSDEGGCRAPFRCVCDDNAGSCRREVTVSITWKLGYGSINSSPHAFRLTRVPNTAHEPAFFMTLLHIAFLLQ